MFGIQPPTWRLLGLTVAAGYAAFGALAILVPDRAAKELLAIEPKKNPEVDDVVSVVFPLLGARDLSIAAALVVLHHARWDRAMGVVIVAGTILCAADTIAAGQRRGPRACVSTGFSTRSTRRLTAAASQGGSARRRSVDLDHHRPGLDGALRMELLLRGLRVGGEATRTHLELLEFRSKAGRTMRRWKTCRRFHGPF